MNGLVQVTGYVSRFDVADRGGDIVRREAFLGARADIPLLWQHDPARPIGRVLSLTEDARGLKMVAGVRFGNDRRDGSCAGRRDDICCALLEVDPVGRGDSGIYRA